MNEILFHHFFRNQEVNASFVNLKAFLPFGKIKFKSTKSFCEYKEYLGILKISKLISF